MREMVVFENRFVDEIDNECENCRVYGKDERDHTYVGIKEPVGVCGSISGLFDNRRVLAIFCEVEKFELPENKTERENKIELENNSELENVWLVDGSYVILRICEY
jgi:hypothetical protein